jgi:hypothetical protein
MASLFAAALASFGCASTSYDVVTRGATTDFDQGPGPSPFVMTSGPSNANDYVVRLSHPICETVAVTPVTTTTYTKPSAGGAIAFIGAGLGVAALGTASWLSAPDQPRDCAEDDDACVTRDQAKGTAAVLWGLGGASVGIGIYRLAQSPKLSRGPYTHNETLPTGVPPHECGPSIANVSVTLSYGDGGLVTTTNDDGYAVFPTCNAEVTAGCIDVTRISTYERASVRADRYELGTVALGTLQGAGSGSQRALQGGGAGSRSAPWKDGTSSQAERLFASILICAAKVWTGNVCAEKLGKLTGSPALGVGMCSAGTQLLEGKQPDPGSISNDVFKAWAAKQLDAEWLATLYDLTTCLVELNGAQSP